MLTSEWITTITAQFNQQPSPYLKEVSSDWKRWELQHQLYTDELHFPQFNSWRTDNNRLRKHLKKIFYALQAFKEMALLDMSKAEKNDILFHLQLIIKINIAKIEMTQLKKLELDYPNNALAGLAQMKKDHMNNLHELEKSLNEKKFSNSFNKQNLPYLHSTFKKHEKNTIDFKKHIDIAVSTGTATGLTSSTYSLTTLIAEIAPSLLRLGTAATASLSAIPILNCIVVGASYVLNAAKTWINKQSPLKKGIATASAALVIGGMIAAGFVPIAAAAITAALTGFGLYFNYIAPWKKTRDQYMSQEKEIHIINTRIQQLINNTNEKEISLEPREKCYLLNSLSKYLQSKIQDPTAFTLAEIQTAKDCIHKGNYENAAANKLIQKAIDDKNLKGNLIKFSSQRKFLLLENIETLKSEHRKNTALMVNGIFSFIGVVLLCIPIPPVMILGAALIIASTIVDNVIRFDVFSRAKNFFSKLFKSNQSTDTEEKSDKTPSPDLQLKSKAELKQQNSVDKIVTVDKPAKKIAFEMKGRKERFALNNRTVPANDKKFEDRSPDPDKTSTKKLH